MRGLYESILDDDKRVAIDIKKDVDLIKIIDVYLKFNSILKFKFINFNVDYQKSDKHTLYKLVYQIDRQALDNIFHNIEEKLTIITKNSDYTFDSNRVFSRLAVTQKEDVPLKLRIITGSDSKDSYLFFKGPYDSLEYIKKYINNKIKK